MIIVLALIVVVVLLFIAFIPKPSQAYPFMEYPHDLDNMDAPECRSRVSGLEQDYRMRIQHDE
jgi:abortive infection bacteriophage resistance protein